MSVSNKKGETKHSILSIDNLLTKAENKFLLSNAIAGRAKQVSDGSLPYVSDFDPTSPISTAIKEIANDKIKVKVLKSPPKESLLAGAPVKEEKKEMSILEELAKQKRKKYAKK